MNPGSRVCSASELVANRAKRFNVSGIPIALVKDESGNIFALGDMCTHGEISLSEGFVEGDALECWAHGSRFSLKTGIPQNLPAYEPVPVFPVLVDGDDVYVDTAAPALAE